jgi:hypothetical protein
MYCLATLPLQLSRFMLFLPMLSQTDFAKLKKQKTQSVESIIAINQVGKHKISQTLMMVFPMLQKTQEDLRGIFQVLDRRHEMGVEFTIVDELRVKAKVCFEGENRALAEGVLEGIKECVNL